MTLRPFLITVTPVFLNELDQAVPAEPVQFKNSEDGSAIDALRKWVDELPAKMAAADG